MPNKPMNQPQDPNSDFYIMIVDDEKDFLDSIRYWFTSQGYRVEVFMSGAEAIEMIKTKKPGIVFLNLQMPQQEGIATLKAIKEVDDRLPVVMLSAFGEEDMSVDAYKLGVNGFFDKSSNFYKAEHLINTLVRVIARRHGTSPHAPGIRTPASKPSRRRLLWVLIGFLVVCSLVLFVAQRVGRRQVCFGRDVCLRVEVADTDAQRQKGLMYRRSLPKGHGMLFIFPQEGVWGFWMKNTRIPLDIIWMDSSGRVVGIARNAQPSDLDQPPVLKNDRPAKYVLEANAGFVDRHEIAVGASAEIR
ncbi:MAG: DUF192 domain-containing protein [Candidatus Omnitrophica bacterium]|nr:DUF192 domain-containing protein [Candidatus Omnitrophota bacterium]